MGKQSFDDLELDTTESPAMFKAQLFALSSVPPDRIKLMIKGKMIKVGLVSGNKK
jgi:ubiquitin carboxyl-terminal hydrolase 14